MDVRGVWIGLEITKPLTASADVAKRASVKKFTITCYMGPE